MSNCCASANAKSFKSFLYTLTLTVLAMVLFLTMSIYSISTITIDGTGDSEDGDGVKFLLQGSKDNIAIDTEKPATTGERKSRQLPVQPVNSTIILTANQTKSSPTFSQTQGYYEEQQPAVVHAESGPTLGYRQQPSAPMQDQHQHYADSLSSERLTDSEYDDERAAEDYLAQDDNDDDGYYKRGPQSADYYADGIVQQQQPRKTAAEKLREQQYDAYYRHYATPTPTTVVPNSKLQQRIGIMNRNRNPYASYGDTADYAYAAARPVQAGAAAYTMLQNRKQQQQPQQYQIQQEQQQGKYQMRRPSQQQYRPRTPTLLEQQKPTASITTDSTPTEPGGVNTLISVVRQLKTMWDVYQAFTSAWNTLAERHQKTTQQQQQQQQEQEQQQKQQEEQQQTRINSKQPPEFAATTQQRRNGTRTKTKASKTKTTTSSTTTTTTMSPTKVAKKLPIAKVEPRKSSSNDDAADKQEFSSSEERKRRAAEPQSGNVGNDENNDLDNGKLAVTETAVAEGRYIKGDPLKGYYDFVITEGSYKFWAVFQVGTAILIIYSTFAAIYYSKVNPLVSDYDYTDYLGGARSLTGGENTDFVDDDDADGNTVATGERWSNWMPRAGHSLKFILDAIDKLPVVEHTDDVVADGVSGEEEV